MVMIPAETILMAEQEAKDRATARAADAAKMEQYCYTLIERLNDATDEIIRLRAALEMARKRIVYYGTISDRRHFDHDLAEVYPKIDAAHSNGDRA